MSEIDWNVMLRRIEREYDGLPPEPSPADLRAQKAAAARAREAQRAAAVGAWLRMLLVAALAASLYWWPTDLATCLSAETMVVVGALWVASFTFQHRLAITHTIAVALLVAGLALVSVQLLPRAGYATFAAVRVDGGWRCGAVGGRR